MLPSGWRAARLEKLMLPDGGIKRGPFGGALKKDMFVPAGYKVYEQRTPIYKDFTLGSYYISADKYEGLKSFSIAAGDFLVSCSGTIGKIVQVPDKYEEGVINQALLRLRLRPGVHEGYFLHMFESEAFQKAITDTTQGGAMKNMVGMSELRKVKIFLPPVEEQRKISEIINSWDSAIEQVEQLIALKEQEKKALMQRLLTGKQRFPEFEGQEWEEVRLGDVFERVRRKNTVGSTSVVTISGQNGFVLQSDYFQKTIASKTLDNYFLVKKGEFAYNKSYSNGYPVGAIKRLNICDEAVVTTLYICFAIKDVSNYCGLFFEQFFEHGSMNKGLVKVANEGGRAHGLLNVTPVDFFKLSMFIPGYKEQQKIASVLNAADREIELLKQKLEAYKEQKKGLMQQLLTGKKRVKISDKEAA